MPFLASHGITEEGSLKTFTEGDMTYAFHDVGEGDPVIFHHVWGPGSSAWLTWHKVIGEFSQHFRCILVDLVNYGKTGPEVFNEPAHSVQTRAVRKIMAHLGIEKAAFVGASMGGTCCIVQALEAPDLVTKIVVGGSHASTGGDPYIIANFPSEGGRSAFAAYADPSRDNLVRYLKAHIHDEQMATEPELVDRVVKTWMDAQTHRAAQAASTSVAHSNLSELHTINVPTLIVHGRFDRMVTVEQALMIMGYIPHADLVVLNRCGHWAPYERPDEYVSAVLPFLLKK